MDSVLSYIYVFADNPSALFAALFGAAFFNTFFPPIPIEMGTVFAGYLVSAGHGSLVTVIISTASGMFAGTAVFYRLAAVYGTALLKKPFFARFASERMLNKARAWLERYGIFALFLARFVPGMYFVTVFTATAASVNSGRLYLMLIVSNTAAFSVLAFAGKLAGDNWPVIYGTMGKAGVMIFATLVTLAVAYFAIKRARSGGSSR